MSKIGILLMIFIVIILIILWLNSKKVFKEKDFYEGFDGKVDNYFHKKHGKGVSQEEWFEKYHKEQDTHYDGYRRDRSRLIALYHSGVAVNDYIDPLEFNIQDFIKKITMRKFYYYFYNGGTKKNILDSVYFGDDYDKEKKDPVKEFTFTITGSVIDDFQIKKYGHREKKIFLKKWDEIVIVITISSELM